MDSYTSNSSFLTYYLKFFHYSTYLIKSLFSGGSFSLEAYRRVYTYDLNWIALKNTMITAGFTTIFGVAIAFPLAFLVGRTDMYGKKVFLELYL